MNCDGVRGLLSAYLDGELSSGELLRVEQHLRRCHDCADEVDSLRQTIALVASMDEVEIPATFHAQLHSRLVALGPPMPAVRRIPAAPGWQRNLGRWAVPAAAAAAAIAVGLTSLPHAQQLAHGLEGAPGKFLMDLPSKNVAESDPPKAGALPPVQTPVSPAQPGSKPNPTPPTSNTGATTTKPGDANTTAPTPSKSNTGSVTPGTTPANPGTPGPAPVTTPETPITPPPVDPLKPGGENTTTPDGGVAVTTPPADAQEPPAPLTPKLTFRSEATVTTANADNLTRALAAYHPTVESDMVIVRVAANQRLAVENAVKNASDVQVVSGFEPTQIDQSGQIHSLESNIANWQRQADRLERDIPKLQGSEKDDALAEHQAIMAKLEDAKGLLELLNSQVDMAIITVHLKVQGR